jgi:hypothetical protein
MPGRRRDGPAQAVTEAFRNSAAIPLPGEFHSPAKVSFAVQHDMCNPLFTLNFPTIAGRSEGRKKISPMAAEFAMFSHLWMGGIERRRAEPIR